MRPELLVLGQLGKRFRAWALRYRFTVFLLSVAMLVSTLVCFALYDSVISARAAERQVQQSGLDAQLSNFLYAVKENGLLDNPAAFSAAERPLSVVTLKSSFYTYLLNRGNARSLTAGKIAWEPPRACVLEFGGAADGDTSKTVTTLQACFSAVAGDRSGRYIYFSLRYPAPAVVRHRPGDSLNSGDRVILTLDSGHERPTQLTLMFEPPMLAASRYPSQLARFAGIHEVSAFPASTPERATRRVNAQAYERSSEEDPRGNIVTVVGRIDPVLFDAQYAEEWPSVSLANMRIGIAIFSGASAGAASEFIKVSPGAAGRSLVSLEKTYMSIVTSGARLDLVEDVEGQARKIWSSADLQLPAAPRRTGAIQWLFDKLARATNLSGSDSVNPGSIKEHLSGGPFGTFSAKLTAEPIRLPEVVTRAFGWLTIALFLLVALLIAGLTVGIRLSFLGRRAASLLKQSTGEFGRIRSPYGHRKDEISRLGRILYLYFNQLSQKNIALARRVRHEAAANARNVRLMEARLELRQDTLDAIGHEIRSPLQTLLLKVDPSSELYAPISRMLNGVDKLYLAASVEEGIGDQEVICSNEDLAAFLSAYVANSSAQTPSMRYSGPSHGVRVSFDPIMFERVLSHLVDNALRYISPNGQLTFMILVRATLDDERHCRGVRAHKSGQRSVNYLMAYWTAIANLTRRRPLVPRIACGHTTRPAGVGMRLTAHIKQSRRAWPARPLVGGTCFCGPHTFAIVMEVVGAVAMELTPMHKRVIALDVHQSKITACALIEQEDGSVEADKREFGAFKRDRRALAQWALEVGPEVVVMESTGVYWKSPFAALEAVGIIAWVVNARHVKAVPGRKTDMADAQWLATLARAGLLRASFIPVADFRQLRLVARQRQKLVGMCSAEKNRLHKVLVDAGIRINVVVSDVHGSSARAMIKALIAGNPLHEVLDCKGRLRASREELFEALSTDQLSAAHRFVAEEIMAHIEQLELRIQRMDAYLLEGLQAWQPQLNLLQTIPGMDVQGAAMLLVEIGADMGAFGSAERLASWVGMCPGNNESAGKRKSGRIRKGNAWVRRLLCEFAQAAARTRCALKAKFDALSIRKGHKKSIVALAHKMLRIIYAMLDSGAHYQDRSVDYEALSVAKNAPRWIKMLRKHGHMPAPAVA